MGKILQGILGGFSGKVGPVVGGKWKDVDYMRSYVIPSNPNTAGQQTQRTRFSQAVSYARQVLSSLCQTFWDPFQSSMSGFNAFMSELLDNMSVANKLTVQVEVTKGTLEGAQIDTAAFAGSVCTVTWDQTIVGNGALTDNVGILAYSSDNDTLEVLLPAATRDDETVDVSPVGMDDGSEGVMYLFFFRGTGSELVVSNSDGFTLVP